MVLWGRGTLDENIKADFARNGQMVKKNLSGFSGATKGKKKGSFQGCPMNENIGICEHYKYKVKRRKEI